MSVDEKPILHGRDHMPDGPDPIPGLGGGSTFTDWVDNADLTAWWRMGDSFTFASSVVDAMLNYATFDANDANRHLDYQETSSSNRPTLEAAHTELGTSDDGAVEFNWTSGSQGPAFFSSHADTLAVAQFGTTANLCQTATGFVMVQDAGYPSSTFALAFGYWGMDGTGSDNVGWVVEVDLDSPFTLRFRAKPNTSTTYTITGPSLVPDQWYHVAVTWDGTNWRLYVNGGFYAATTGTSAPGAHADGTGFLVSYAKYDSGASFSHRMFYGRIDEVALYRRVLTDLEIARLAGWFD